MARVGISEFTFGYAFLHEQTQRNWTNLRAAPVLPSLVQEQGKGWDAKLPLTGVDFYYQFKLSDYLSHGNSAFIADGTYSGPYYRLALYRKNNNEQHRRLKEHAQANPYTYYVAPEFNAIEEFNAAFLARQITENSRIIPVADCDNVLDGHQHYITFRPGQLDWDQRSERRRHERSYTGRDLDKLYHDSSHNWRNINNTFAKELFERTSAVARKTIDGKLRGYEQKFSGMLNLKTQRASTHEILLASSDILSVFLGVTLVLVGTSQKSKP